MESSCRRQRFLEGQFIHEALEHFRPLTTLCKRSKELKPRLHKQSNNMQEIRKPRSNGGRKTTSNRNANTRGKLKEQEDARKELEQVFDRERERT